MDTRYPLPDRSNERRERLSDITFAMRIISRQFADDMTVLLSRADVEVDYSRRNATLRKAAELAAQIAQQTIRYTRYVEGATGRRV